MTAIVRISAALHLPLSANATHARLRQAHDTLSIRHALSRLKAAESFTSANLSTKDTPRTSWQYRAPSSREERRMKKSLAQTELLTAYAGFDASAVLPWRCVIMPRRSIAFGLTVLALACAGASAAVAQSAGSLDTGSLSGQNLTNSVGGVPGSTGTPNQDTLTQNLGAVPTDASSAGSYANLTGSVLPASELGDVLSGVPLTEGADPAKWGLKQGLGEPLVMAGDLALKSKGHQGGLAGQGVDPNQITGPLSFDGVMPQQTLSAGQMGSVGQLPASASGFTSLFGLGN
jgi:hypothetical protein